MNLKAVSVGALLVFISLKLTAGYFFHSDERVIMLNCGFLVPLTLTLCATGVAITVVMNKFWGKQEMPELRAIQLGAIGLFLVSQFLFSGCTLAILFSALFFILGSSVIGGSMVAWQCVSPWLPPRAR